MPEVQTTTTATDRPLSSVELQAANRIRWAHEAPRANGDMHQVFGLSRIVTSVPGGSEITQMGKDGQPTRVFQETPTIATHMTSPLDASNRLFFANLRNYSPIRVLLAQTGNVIQPFNPDQINTIGDFVVEVDSTINQDYESRLVAQAQQGVLRMYQDQLDSGAIRDDVTIELINKFIEDASVHVKLLEETRKELPSKVRALIPKAKELGILRMDQAWEPRGAFQLDPLVIGASYTPDTDNLSLPEFLEHQRNVVVTLPSVGEELRPDPVG